MRAPGRDTLIGRFFFRPSSLYIPYARPRARPQERRRWQRRPRIGGRRSSTPASSTLAWSLPLTCPGRTTPPVRGPPMRGPSMDEPCRLCCGSSARCLWFWCRNNSYPLTTTRTARLTERSRVCLPGGRFLVQTPPPRPPYPGRRLGVASGFWELTTFTVDRHGVALASCLARLFSRFFPLPGGVISRFRVFFHRGKQHLGRPAYCRRWLHTRGSPPPRARWPAPDRVEDWGVGAGAGAACSAHVQRSTRAQV